MNSVNLKTILLVAAALPLAGAALAGSALPNDKAADAPSVLVSYSDLNLQTPAGAQSLHRRLEAAARSVCPDEYSRDLRAAATGRECIAQAVARAVAAVAQPQLAQVHAQAARRG